jgi:hypothetical protein
LFIQTKNKDLDNPEENQNILINTKKCNSYSEENNKIWFNQTLGYASGTRIQHEE